MNGKNSSSLLFYYIVVEVQKKVNCKERVNTEKKNSRTCKLSECMNDDEVVVSNIYILLYDAIRFS